MQIMEFQAVVLAGGRGTRLPELISDRPKCLLQVGPFPLIWYPMNMLQTNGFQDILCIVLESQKSEIQLALDKLPLKLKIEFATIPSDSDYGTAESLKHVKEKLKTDVLIVSCDCVTNASIQPLLNDYRMNDAAFAAFFFNSGAEQGVIIPGPKNINKAERDLVCLNPTNNQILFVGSTSDFEETVNFPGCILRKHKRICLHSTLIDSHIYVMKKWLIDYLAQNEGISTLKGEFLPYVVQRQMSRPPKYDTNEKPYSSLNSSGKVDDIFNFIVPSQLEHKVFSTSLNKKITNEKSWNPIKCFATIATKESIGIRVNAIQGFCAANQKMLNEWDSFFADKSIVQISENSNIKSTQMQQCIVAGNATIAEKTSLQKCIIGPNVVIKPKVRLTNTILMNGATIEEGVTIENSVICERAVVQCGSTLKSCLVGTNFMVSSNSKAEKMLLTNSDGFMEIE